MPTDRMGRRKYVRGCFGSPLETCAPARAFQLPLRKQIYIYIVILYVYIHEVLKEMRQELTGARRLSGYEDISQESRNAEQPELSRRVRGHVRKPEALIPEAQDETCAQSCETNSGQPVVFLPVWHQNQTKGRILQSGNGFSSLEDFQARLEQPCSLESALSRGWRQTFVWQLTCCLKAWNC